MSNKILMHLNHGELSVLYSALMNRRQKLRSAVIFFEQRKQEDYADQAYAELAEASRLLDRVNEALTRTQED